MTDRRLIDDYENALMNLAVSEMMDQYGKELEEKYKDAEDISPSPEAAKKFEKDIDKAYRNGKILTFRTNIMKFGRYAVTACAAVIIVFAVSVISVDALRFKFLEWLTNIHGSHSSLDVNSANSSNYDIMHADYLPPKYELVSYNNGGYLVEICYSNKVNEIKIRVYLNDCTFNADSNDTSSEEIYVNGNKGQYQKKEISSTILWYDGENSYWLSTNDLSISKKELVEIAQSIS